MSTHLDVQDSHLFCRLGILHLSYNQPLSDIANIRLGHPFRGTVKQYDNGDVNVVKKLCENNAMLEISVEELPRPHLKSNSREVFTSPPKFKNDLSTK